MLYIISIIHYTSNALGEVHYRAFDTYSHSAIYLKPDLLKDIILNTKIKVVNASIQAGQIILTDWVHGIHMQKGNGTNAEMFGAKHILLVIKNSIYKIVDYKGNVYTINKRELRKIAISKEIANCILLENENGYEILATDTYEVCKDEEFETLITEKYNKFIAKTNMLGIGGISFEYEIENHKVKLKKYTGSNQNVILPSFITAIMQEAFVGSNIKTIRLNEGLKVIGNRAFANMAFENRGSNAGIEHIDIPETVEIIGIQAFMDNDRITAIDGTLNTARFKLRNTKTIVFDQGVIVHGRGITIE